MFDWIADCWIDAGDWVAMRAGELWAWLRAGWRKASVWLVAVLLTGRKHD